MTKEYIDYEEIKDGTSSKTTASSAPKKKMESKVAMNAGAQATDVERNASALLSTFLGAATGSLVVATVGAAAYSFMYDYDHGNLLKESTIFKQTWQSMAMVSGITGAIVGCYMGYENPEIATVYKNGEAESSASDSEKKIAFQKIMYTAGLWALGTGMLAGAREYSKASCDHPVDKENATVIPIEQESQRKMPANTYVMQ